MQAASQTIAQRSDAKMTREHRRMLLSCFFGTTIEWYDFLIYAFLAPIVFDRLFFPKLNPSIGLIAVFGVFAVGFAARPLGGAFFGHFGDRIGRKPIMIMTLVTMGLSTTLVGLLPTYATIGMAAPIILTILRFLQGFALGGENTAGGVLALESAPDGKRGFFASLVQSGAAAGTVLGSLAVSLFAGMNETSLLTWGWRIPFLLSIIIFSVGMYIRLKVEESPIFEEAVARTKAFRAPIAVAFSRFKLPLLQVALCSVAESSVFYFTSVFGLAYGLQTLHLDRGTLLLGVTLGNLVGIVANPFWGWASDRAGRRLVMGGSFALAALFVAFAFFPMLASGNNALVVLAMAIPGAILQPMSLAVDGSFYPEMFPDARVRFTGAAVGKQIGSILGGGIMPAVSATILASTGGNLTLVILYFVTLCVVALGAVWSAPETSERSLSPAS